MKIDTASPIRAPRAAVPADMRDAGRVRFGAGVFLPSRKRV